MDESADLRWIGSTREPDDELATPPETSDPRLAALRDLTDEKMCEWVHKGFTGQKVDSNEVVGVGMSGFVIRDKARTLKPGTWLNDSVVNTAAELLASNGHMVVLSSFLLPKYAQKTGGGYNAVRRWYRKDKIFCYGKIAIPVNILNAHWILLVADVAKGSILTYDPFKGHSAHTDRATVFRNFLQDLFDDTAEQDRGDATSPSSWNLGTPTQQPKQKDGFNCGVFAILTAMHLAHGRDVVTYSITKKGPESDYYRSRIAAVLARSLLKERTPRTTRKAQSRGAKRFKSRHPSGESPSEKFIPRPPPATLPRTGQVPPSAIGSAMASDNDDATSIQSNIAAYACLLLDTNFWVGHQSCVCVCLLSDR